MIKVDTKIKRVFDGQIIMEDGKVGKISGRSEDAR